ncbi:hypothetical protein KJ575_00220 [Patescibacteria group bacterium]|nr:hypothetical protein [Patescibacteria group bacterium]MBU4368131.1 hypothetical protein [Patescibacteria group bacterium]
MTTPKIILATRTDKNSYEKCLKDIEHRFVNNQSIEKIFIICDQNIPDTESGKIKTIFDLNPTRQTAFNLVIEKLREDQNNKFHLLTFSKEVGLQNKYIDKMIKIIDDSDNLIVVGYRLKDNILNDSEVKLYSNGDLQNGNVGIAYQVPWNTCALWNKKFVYGKDKKKLIFDEICEEKNNQLGHLYVKVNDALIETEFEGMEDGIAIAALISNNENLKFKLIDERLCWKIVGDCKRETNHKIKMARKNIVLSTFMNIKGYSIDKLREAGH